MNQIFNNILLILMMNGMVMLIPGVNFLIVARQSILNGLLAGLFCAFGITMAIVVHASLAAYSVSVLLDSHPLLFETIKYTGAAYLLYLGTRFLISSLKNHSLDMNVGIDCRKKEAFRSGFIVDLFNPFIGIFYLSLFSILVIEENSLFEMICYLAVILLLNGIWFAFVATCFSRDLLKERLKNKSRHIQALSGLAMYYFSSKVIFGF